VVGNKREYKKLRRFFKLKSRTLILCGILSPILYILATIIGGLLIPEYSHIKNAVSELIQSGAPNKLLLVTLMVISSISTILGCLGIILTHKKRINKLVTTGIILILINGLLGLLTYTIFPQDPIHAPMTLPGIMHIVIVAISALITIVSPLLVGFGICRNEGWESFKLYSIISVLIIFIAGGLTPFIILKEIPLMGLIQRIAIGAYFQWFIVLSIKFYKYKNR